MKRLFNVGDLVAVKYNPFDKIPNIGAKKYDGTSHRVSKITDYGAHGKLYELEGAVSDKGVPYIFMKEDLEMVK